MNDRAKLLKPLPLGHAIVYFGIPSLILVATIYIFIPALAISGFSPIFGFVALGIPLLVLFTAAIVAFRIEGHPWTWAAFRVRYRLQRPLAVDWLWIAGATIAYVGSYLGLGFTAELIEPYVWSLPESLTRIFEGMPAVFAGQSLKGNWGIGLLYLIVLFFNIFGEELWWRGHVLPRQEISHGSRAWAVHGSLWTLFHIFWAADLIRILPGALALSFAVQKRKNTWIGIVAHAVLNGLGFVTILSGIVGDQ
jgi:membrane protease YdiL (CAAX protease family)